MCKVLKRLFCNHKKLKFIRNIYGDEVNIKNGTRSIWKCENCGKLIFKDKIHYMNKGKR